MPTFAKNVDCEIAVDEFFSAMSNDEELEMLKLIIDNQGEEEILANIGDDAIVTYVKDHDLIKTEGV